MPSLPCPFGMRAAARRLLAFSAAAFACAASPISSLPNADAEAQLASAAVCLLQKSSAHKKEPLAQGRALGDDTLAHPKTTFGSVLLNGLSWNSHWQCSENPECLAAATTTFVELTKLSDAHFAVAIQLGKTSPVDLPSSGLLGWTQVDGTCRSAYGDTLALVLAPGYSVQAQGGGCLSTDYDARAFAVARVKPPAHVYGCDELCIVGIHAPHSPVLQGKSTVASVCADLVQQCVVAMGDWNREPEGLLVVWQDLIGGSSPHIIAPNERTCCWPEWKYYNAWYDHLATNVAHAHVSETAVYDYPNTHLLPESQHKPISVQLILPS
eukprot:CAMPEP_0203878534 /NCGR_PEP_ID=MMETSP0359-20131031/23076_1 /ASSEMBLY_ACC=CAM_ASM_000338 /TAXON_ID=268821 /ORGANISM="Scrippsiella Hangoei, Strain SHTV-5" /LENGTH=324 /DNA_ID=CAMNT_0050797747 /DNA_START=15 /DNA_END=989 /DNA_ORIENTATION=+